MKKVILLAMLLTICVGCSKSDPVPWKERQDIPLTKAEEEMVEVGNQFAFDLFKRVHADEEGLNLFISPLSAGLALGMTTNGAAGETEAGMLQTLGFSGYPVETLNAYYSKMSRSLLTVDPQTTLGIANSIWLRNTFRVLPDFVSVNKEMYQAEVQSRDFADPATLKDINKWCADKTNNRIPKIIDEISPYDVAYLINAIYFKGTWKYNFDKKNTKDAYFHAEDGSARTVKMMNKEGMSLNYMENNRYQLLELPYGNEAFSMVVLLPKDDQPVGDVIQSLSADEWSASLEAMQPQKVDVQLPRFKLEYSKKLNNVLSDMGMDMAFDSRADFTKINPEEPLSISFVLQKTFVEVNEEGTEAAAVTVVGVLTTSAGPVHNIQFIADRPFVYAIKEKSTGCILFIGKLGALD